MIEILLMLVLLSQAAVLWTLGKYSAPKNAFPEAAAPPESDEEETKRSRAVDEGIENLMTFQVSVGKEKMTGGKVL